MERWWDTTELEENVWYRWMLNGAAVYLRRDASLLTCAYTAARWREKSRAAFEDQGALFGGPMDAPPPSDAVYTVTASASAQAAITPFLSGKPFLAGTEHLRLFPGAELSLRLELPPSLRLSASGETLFSFSPFIVNETWYGEDTMTGMLCYSLRASAPQIADADPNDAFPRNAGAGIVCPLLVRNKSKTVLAFENLPLYTGELSIYELGRGTDAGLCTDTAVIDAWGGGEFRTSVRRPRDDDAYRLLCAGTESNMGDILIKQGTRIIKHAAGR
ncbi:MAG: hypothetical protein LBB82_07100 [Treponema sp.]|jgi:hypothetical protein|nr:hypothetical protein [Treponema sp.]